jgi:hypothetical protein
MGTQGSDQDVVGQAGQVTARTVQGVLRHDGHPGGLRVGRPEDGSHGPDSAGDDLIGPAEGIPGLHFLEEGPVRMLPHPLVQKGLETVLRGADEGKGSLGPAVPGLVVRKGLEEHGPPGLVQVSVPHLVWSLPVRPEARIASTAANRPTAASVDPRSASQLPRPASILPCPSVIPCSL